MLHFHLNRVRRGHHVRGRMRPVPMRGAIPWRGHARPHRAAIRSHSPGRGHTPRAVRHARVHMHSRVHWRPRAIAMHRISGRHTVRRTLRPVWPVRSSLTGVRGWSMGPTNLTIRWRPISSLTDWGSMHTRHTLWRPMRPHVWRRRPRVPRRHIITARGHGWWRRRGRRGCRG